MGAARVVVFSDAAAERLISQVSGIQATLQGGADVLPSFIDQIGTGVTLPRGVVARYERGNIAPMHAPIEGLARVVNQLRLHRIEMNATDVRMFKLMQDRDPGFTSIFQMVRDTFVAPDAGGKRPAWALDVDTSALIAGGFLTNIERLQKGSDALEFAKGTLGLTDETVALIQRGSQTAGEFGRDSRSFIESLDDVLKTIKGAQGLRPFIQGAQVLGVATGLALAPGQISELANGDASVKDAAAAFGLAGTAVGLAELGGLIAGGPAVTATSLILIGGSVVLDHLPDPERDSMEHFQSNFGDAAQDVMENLKRPDVAINGHNVTIAAT